MFGEGNIGEERVICGQDWSKRNKHRFECGVKKILNASLKINLRRGRMEDSNKRKCKGDLQTTMGEKEYFPLRNR